MADDPDEKEIEPDDDEDLDADDDDDFDEGDDFDDEDEDLDDDEDDDEDEAEAAWLSRTNCSSAARTIRPTSTKTWWTSPRISRRCTGRPWTPRSSGPRNARKPRRGRPKGESTPPAPKADVRVRVGGRGVSLAALRARPVVPATEPAQPPPHPIRRRRPASGWAADRYPWTS